MNDKEAADEAGKCAKYRDQIEHDQPPFGCLHKRFRDHSQTSNEHPAAQANGENIGAHASQDIRTV